MDKLLFSLGLIITGLAVGYILQHLVNERILTLPLAIGDLRKLLQKIGLLFFMPISFLAAVWIVSFENLRIIWLPVIGGAALLGGGFCGYLIARLLKSGPQQTGVLICCGSFTNIGSIGALVCFMFLGEAGFALVALYKMFEETIYYTIGFPIARFYGGEDEAILPFGRRFMRVVTDPFVAAALSSFSIGLALNLTGIARPLVFESITALFVPLGTFLLLVSIGLGMRFSQVTDHTRPGLLVCLIKFGAIPALACSLAYAAGLHQIAGGLPFQVVLILSSMPVAFNALVAASIYDLDLDLANSCWLLSTAALLAVLPLQYLLLA